MRPRAQVADKHTSNGCILAAADLRAWSNRNPSPGWPGPRAARGFAELGGQYGG